MRIGRMGKREWLWTLGCLLVQGVLSVIVSVPLIWVTNALHFVEPIERR